MSDKISKARIARVGVIFTGSDGQDWLRDWSFDGAGVNVAGIAIGHGETRYGGWTISELAQAYPESDQRS